MTVKKYLSEIETFEGKTIIITGATAGIGLELAKELVAKEANLVILARNLSKANKVRETLLSINNNVKVDIVEYDQSDYELIDSAVKEIKDKYSNFDALVANAGILYPPKGALSKQGYPLTIDTNYLGLKRFLDQIIPFFNNKRIVMHGSLVADAPIKEKIDIYSDKYSLFKQYNISKACVEALWYHYYTNYKNNELILTEPGITSSDIFRGFPWFLRVVGKQYVKIFSHSVPKASLCMLKALTKDSKSGDYIVPRGPLTKWGYPKYKKFPNKRKREFLINKTRN